MTKRLNIGTDADGKLFTFPADAVTQTFAALARRGAGKTNTAVVMAEEMLERGDCIVVLDPIGVWTGLRSSFDGKSKGFPILILGGEHGDLPLDAHAGKTVAEFLVADRVPTILDVSAFGEGEMRRFVADFAERFYQINRQPVHWFVDEADEFAPQSGYNADGARCLGAMQNIVRRGRARGIGCTLITQRSAVLNKSVLTQTECLIALQTTAPQDMDAIKGWLQYHAGKAEVETILATLPKFQRGEAWVYSPGWLKGLTRIQVRQRTTFDSSATPASGQKRSEPKTVAQIDLGQLGERIKAAAETAKANDPKELRKQVADLKAQLAKAEAAKPAAKPEIQRVDVPVVTEADLKRIDKAEAKVSTVVAEAIGRIEKVAADHVAALVAAVEPFKALLERVKAIKAGPDPIALARKSADFGTAVHVNARGCKPMTPPAARAIGQIAKAATTLAARGRSESDSGLSKLERALLTVMAQRPNERIEKGKLLTLADYRWSGNVSDAFTKFINEGLAVGDRSAMQITESGIAVLGDFEPLPTGEALRQQILAKCSTLERALLEVLFSIYPNRISKGELLERAGYKWSGNVSDAFTKFLRAGWAVGSRSELAASPELFEE